MRDNREVSWAHAGPMMRRTLPAAATKAKNGDLAGAPMSEETLDALFHGKLKLFQSRSGYRFSLDALLLAYFVSVRPHETVVDLGTGNGVIPLVLANLHSQISITGIELQSGMAERAERNVKLNGLEGRVQIRCGDVRAIDAIAPPESVDAVVCNPPFRKSSSG